MACVIGKNIELLLYGSDLDGVFSLKSPQWSDGELFSASREQSDELATAGAFEKPGIFLLLSGDERVYVGQVSPREGNLLKTIKERWERGLILTTREESFSATDLCYLEAMLVEKAQRLGKIANEHQEKRGPKGMDKYRKAFLDQYLTESLFLIQLLGHRTFLSGTVVRKEQEVDRITRLKIGKRCKGEAIELLGERGLLLKSGETTYAVKNANHEFWANPLKEMLHKDWCMILNDNEAMELLLLRIPKDTLTLCEQAPGEDASTRQTGKALGLQGLQVRTDNPDRLDLRIQADTLTERLSGHSFLPYLVERVSYG